MSTDSHIANLDSRYRALRQAGAEHLFETPVLRLGLDMAKKLENDTISTAETAAMIRAMTRDALDHRARRLAAWAGDMNRVRNEETLEKLLEQIAAPRGKKRPFAEFCAIVERGLYGFVFTAHPTFTMTRALSSALTNRAARYGGADVDAGDDNIDGAMEIPFRTPDLTQENDFALEAIDQLHSAIWRARHIALRVARTHYGREWKKLRPHLCSVGSWVGFDLDGRQDIGWTVFFSKRIAVQMRQIESLKTRIAALLGQDATIDPALEKAHALLRDTLDDLRGHYDFFEEYDAEQDEGFKSLQLQSRALVKGTQTRLIHPDKIIAHLSGALDKTTKGDMAVALAHLLSDLQHTGLARAEMHVRINAAQLQNAMRRHIEINTHPDDPQYRQANLDQLEALIKRKKPSLVNFGDILREQTSARRQFMVLQQIVKHIDAHSPIRFLIAETESAFTILSALYFARRFGIDRHMDICPLFETQTALERGTKYMESLLDIPVFAAYIRARGRLCIQTGYSDAGRYIGQTPAGASIERLKERMLRVMADKGFSDIELLFFDTHGESIGRGGHPESVTKRMEYICPPAYRAMLDKQGQTYIQEDAWQGGDGYLPFMSEDAALATLTRAMGYFLNPAPAKAMRDPFYDDRQSVNQFFSTITTAQTGLMARPEYGALLSAYGPNLMHGTGSRAIKRQSDRARPDGQVAEARQFRAIPHNAILMQMGLLANSVTGAGNALRTHPEFYARMRADSPRFDTLMTMIKQAALLSDPMILKAYIDLLDPQLWLMRHDANELHAAVARHLRHHGYHPQMRDIFQDLFEDFSRLRQYLPLHETEMDEQTRAMRARVACLHAMRIGLMHHIFTLAMRIPHYNPAHPLDRQDLLQMIFRLDVERAVEELRRIFPARPPRKAPYDFGEDSDYMADNDEGYAHEHRHIFDPMMAMHRQIQDISTAIAHYAGFMG